MQRILVSVTNDISTDQRVYRTCSTLTEMGYEIILIGRKLSNSLTLDRTYKTVRMKLLFNKGFLFYTEYNVRLFFKLLFTKKDILLANDLDTLLPNFLMSRLQAKKLVFDSHELFSEIPELVERPKVKWFWRFLERKIIPKLRNCYTVSDGIANYYKLKYRTDFKVVRNLPVKKEVETSESFVPDLKDKRIILYQGAVNVGRGLELLIEAMPLIENAVFLIVGEGDILEELQTKVIKAQLNDMVRFLGKLFPQELKKVTSTATIGISLEEDLGLNYHYALPNKLFDYIQTQIPVVVSDLPEMRKIVEEYDVGIVLRKRTTNDVANTINLMLEKGKANWKNQLEKASKELTWENESIKLKELIQSLK